MVHEAVYLVPVGSARFELYTEPSAEVSPGAAAPEPSGFWRTRIHQLHDRWQHTVQAAQSPRGAEGGRLARARNWFVRRIADSIAEQRTLWSLRRVTSASFVFPTSLSESAATETRQQILTHARRHHGRWAIVNVAGVALTAVLVLLPGPNVIGYYFAFRLVGHYLAWRGARRALEHITWQPTAEPALVELGALAALPREQRAERVAAVAERLHLPRLTTFFDRVAIPDR